MPLSSSSSPQSASMLTATHKYAAGALFSLALHQAQIHQTSPLGFPTDDQRTSNTSSSDSVADDPQLWVHHSSGLLHPLFKYSTHNSLIPILYFYINQLTTTELLKIYSFLQHFLVFHIIDVYCDSRFLEIDGRAWSGLEETAVATPASHHIGAVSFYLLYLFLYFIFH